MKTLKVLVSVLASPFLFSCLSPAASLTWDADPATAGAQDGNGAWTNGLPNTNWWNGTANTNWTGANPDSATFGFTGGTGVVSLAGPVTVSNITFADSYLIQSNTLTLSSASTVTVNSNATINSILAGGGLVKAGAAALTLSGASANTCTGTTTVTAGTIILSKSDGVAAIPGNLVIYHNANVWATGNNQLGGTSTIISNGDGTTWAAFTLLGTTQTIAGLNNPANNLMVANSTTSQTGTPSPTGNGAGMLILSGAGSYTFGGDLWNYWGANGGTLGLVLTGGGTQTLTGAQITYSGSTIISNGLLALQNTTAFASPVTVNSGTTLLFNNISATGDGNANATLNLNGGAMVYNPAGNAYWTWAAPVTVSATSTIDVTAGGITTAGFYLDGGLKGGAPLAVTSHTAGLGLVLRNANSTYGGTLTVNGNASAGNGTGGGLALQSDPGGMANAALTVNGTLELGGEAGGMGWASPSPSGQTTKIDALNGAGVVVANFAGASTASISVGNNNGSGAFSGVIANGDHDTMSFVKAGSGTQSLSGTNTYTGPTTINGGTLALGVGGAITGTPLIVIATGAVFDVSSLGNYALANFQSLEGGGMVTGGITMAAGGKLIPGTPGTLGTLAFANDLDLNAGTTNYFDLGGTTGVGGGTNDLVTVGGNLAGSNSVIAINELAPPANGSYVLFTYGGVLLSHFNPVILGASTVRSQTWTLDQTNAGLVTLDVAGGAAGSNLAWRGYVSSNWDLVTTNWLDGAAQDRYYDGDFVTFDDGTATTTVNLATSVIPGSITITAVTNAYTFAGPGGLSGSGPLLMIGSNALTLNTTNVFTGPVSIGAGSTLTLGGAGKLGGGTFPGAITNNGVFACNSSAAQTLSGVISGTGTVTESGTGALTISGANTFSGSTTLAGTGGQMILSAPDGAMAVPGNMYMSAAGTRSILSAGANNQFGPNSVMYFMATPGDTRLELTGTTQTLAGVDSTGFAGTYAAIEHHEFGPLTPPGATSVLILDVSGTNSYLFGNSSATAVIRDYNGGKLYVVKNGAGTQTLLGSGITYTGGTIVSNGVLVLQDTTAFASAIVVTNGGSLNLNRSVAGFASRSQMAGNAITGNGTININCSSGGITGGWVTVGSASGWNFSGTINVNSGVLCRDNTTLNNITGSAAVNVATGGIFSTRGGGVIIGALNGAGAVSPLWSGANATTLTLGNGDGSGVFTGTIHGNGSSGTDGNIEGGTLALIKTGAGTQTLSGTNTYTGATTINGGVLQIGAGGSISNSPLILLTATNATFDVSPILGSFTLASIQTLEGFGTVSGPVTAVNGSTVIPGTNGGVGTLTFTSNLTEAAGTTNIFDVSTNAPNDQLNVGGLFAANGATLEINPLTPLTSGTYVIGTYGSTNGSSAFNPLVVNLNSGLAPGFLTVTLTNGQILLTEMSRSTKWYGLVSYGAGNTNWDTNISTNWYDTGSSTPGLTFLSGDQVLFDDTPGVTNVVSLVGTLQPGTVTVTTRTNAFQFVGAGGIGGTASLTMSGTNTLTILTTNSYTGPTTINSGTLAIGGSGSLGGGTYAAAITNNGAFTYSSAANQTLSGVISGTGAVVMTGSGTLYLGLANNTFTGPFNIVGGTVQQNGANNPICSTNTAVTVSNAALKIRYGSYNVNWQQYGSLTLAGGATLEAAPQYQSDNGDIGFYNNITVIGTNTFYATGGSNGKENWLQGGMSGDTNAYMYLSNGFGYNVYAAYHAIMLSGGVWSNYFGTFNDVNDIAIQANIDLRNAAVIIGGNAYLQNSTGYLIEFGSLSGTGRLNANGQSGSEWRIGNLGTSTTYSGIIDGSNRVTKVGAGTLALAGLSTYAGTTAISNGALIVNGSVGTGAVTVVSGATLGGTGVVNGAVTSGGIVAPGAPGVGTLTLASTYTQNAGGVLGIELAGNGTNDLLNVSGTANLGGTLSVTNVNNGYVPAAGDTFTILQGTVTNSFAATNLPPLTAGLAWSVQYAAGSVVLSVSNAPVTGYAGWASVITNGMTGYNQSATGDGYPNLLKYATGSNPTQADNLASMGGGLTNGAPTFTFNYNTNATDVTLIVEGSFSATDGATWAGITTNADGAGWSPTNGVSVTGAGSTNPVSVSVVDPFAGSTNRFLRLRVTLP